MPNEAPPTAQISGCLFDLASRLDAYNATQRYNPTQRRFWGAVVEQLDTLASVIAEQDEICDACGLQRATGKDRLCDRCAMDEDYRLGLIA